MFKACVFKILLLAQGKVHIAKMRLFYQKWAFSFAHCVFHHLQHVQKNKRALGPEGPFFQ